MKNRISIFYFTLVVLFTILFTALLIFDTKFYDGLSNEDYIIEYLSALFLLISSLSLLRGYLHLRKSNSTSDKYLKFITINLSILFFLAAGEEISWGQRIFSISTPEYLSSINDQNEINIHNINKLFFDTLLDKITKIFVIISSIFFVLKKDLFIGIKKPNIFIICSFAITSFYRENNIFVNNLSFFYTLYLPLFGLLVYALINKLKLPSFAILVTFIIGLLIPIIHTKYNHLFPLHKNSANEFREFLFCLSCLAYSFEIMDTTILDIQDLKPLKSRIYSNY